MQKKYVFVMPDDANPRRAGDACRLVARAVVNDDDFLHEGEVWSLNSLENGFQSNRFIESRNNNRQHAFLLPQPAVSCESSMRSKMAESQLLAFFPPFGARTTDRNLDATATRAQGQEAMWISPAAREPPRN